jgi:hypothetical protein
MLTRGKRSSLLSQSVNDKENNITALMTAEGMLLSLLERNIRQSWKCLPGAYALAYFV